MARYAGLSFIITRSGDPTGMIVGMPAYVNANDPVDIRDIPTITTREELDDLLP